MTYVHWDQVTVNIRTIIKIYGLPRKWIHNKEETLDNFCAFLRKEIVYKTHLFLLLMRSEVIALCSLGGGGIFLIID